jgi:hypothetical protein
MVGRKTLGQMAMMFLLMLLGGSWTHLAGPVAGQTISAALQSENCARPEVSSLNLSSTICTSRVHYSFGGIVDVVLTIANTGVSTIQLNTISGSVFIIDRTGAPKLRQADLNFCITPEGCTLPVGQSISEVLARWVTNETFSLATLSGRYMIHAFATACPTGAHCLEVDDAMIQITVSVPN